MTEMQGMSSITGDPIDGMDHLRQSIRDILTTPIGSRVMRRDYGCNLMSLLDRPMNSNLVGDIQVAVAMALANHEPRVQLSRVLVESAPSDTSNAENQLANGGIHIHLEGSLLPAGQQFILKDVLQS